MALQSAYCSELELLLDSISSEGYEIVPVSELAGHATVAEFSNYLFLVMPVEIEVDTPGAFKLHYVRGNNA
jgi:hypothetical protein